MQKIKRPISILLSVLMVVSLFAIVPLTASAATTKNFEDKLKVENTTTTLAARTWTWSDTPSGAVYNGKLKDTTGDMTFYTDQDSQQGFVTTASGGTAVSIRLDWAINLNTLNRKKVYIYGKNSAYTSYTDVFDSSKRGTLINTINVGSNKQETFTISGNYKYIAFRVGVTSGTNDNIYIDNILVTWQKNYYRVKWNNYNGTTIETDDEVLEGTTPTYDSATPTKPQDDEYTYTFSGWSPTVSAATQDITYTAQFTATKRKYAVTFKNGDEVLQTGEVEYGQRPSYTGATPTKEDSTGQYTYTFKGWKNGAITYAPGAQLPAVQGAVTYTAVFDSTVNKYTITWLNDDGSLIDTTTVEYGVVPTHADPTKAETAQYTYTFAGWDTTPVAVTGEATYKATFTPVLRQYKVKWNNQGAVREDNVDYGTHPSYGSTPTKTETAEYTYTFAGWNDGTTTYAPDAELPEVTGDVEYEATFTSTKRSYTITWLNDDDSLIDTTTVEYGTVPTHADATKASTAQYDYTFAGWDTTPVAVTGEATYKATFTSNLRSYTITWLNDDDSLIDTTTVEYGTVPTHADATKASTAQYDYTFAGWDPEVVAVTGEATYKATFTQKEKPKFFAGNTISLKEAIYLNYYIDPVAAGITLEDVTDGDKTISIDFAWETTPAPKSKISECSTVISKDNYKKVGNYFVVSCKVCAAEMSCVIKATGTVGSFTDTLTYSVREYCKIILDPNSEFSVKFKTDNGEEKYKDLVDLVKKTLDYGTKAQTVFNIIPDDPANSILSDNPNDFTYYSMSDVTTEMVEDAIYATNHMNASNMNDVANALGAKYYLTSLFYLSNNTLRHVFTKNTAAFNPNDYDGSQANYYYYVEKGGIAAAQLDKLQQFTVGSVTFFYSPLDYAKAVIGSGMSQNDKNLAKSLYWYNQAAKKYFP